MDTRDRDKLVAAIAELLVMSQDALKGIHRLVSEKDQGRRFAEKYRDLYVEKLNDVEEFSEPPEENVLPWELDPPCPGEDEG